MSNWTTQQAEAALRRAGVANPLAAACGEKGAKRSKYNSRKKCVDGITFDSAREAKRYQELKAMEAAGEIQALTLQPEYVLQPACRVAGKKQRAIVYRADFFYMEGPELVHIVEDVKGYMTPVYKLKRKMFLAQYPEYEFREVR